MDDFVIGDVLLCKLKTDATCSQKEKKKKKGHNAVVSAAGSPKTYF